MRWEWDGGACCGIRGLVMGWQEFKRCNSGESNVALSYGLARAFERSGMVELVFELAGG